VAGEGSLRPDSSDNILNVKLLKDILNVKLLKDPHPRSGLARPLKDMERQGSNRIVPPFLTGRSGYFGGAPHYNVAGASGAQYADMMRRSSQKIVHDAVAASLRRAHLKPGALILIGLSGGPDSVALLHALIELRDRFRYSVVAAHLNHRLRGAESNRDEQFVRELCPRLKIEINVERSDELRQNSSNLEEHARMARHDFLNRAANAAGAELIALGHHRDDQAETVLMRLLRGSGAAGLSAMSERGPGRLFRPMLSVSRAEILAYLDESRLGFIEDSSNRSSAILRNRIRRDLLPMLEREYASGLGARLASFADEMASVDDLMTTLANEEIESMKTREGSLDISNFAGLHPALQASVVRFYLRRRIGSLRRIGRSHIEAAIDLIVRGGPSAKLNLPGGWRIEREYNLLRATELTGKPELGRFSVPLNLDGLTIVKPANMTFSSSTILAADAMNPGSMPQDLSVAMFDGARLTGSRLIVRNFEPGDRISPIGMTGTRKVKDLFIDRKLPRAKRSNFPIVILGGEVAWLPGMARSRSAIVTKASETVLRVEASESAT
jgi:tRNA(Ile)-lysidine synthase